MTKGRGESGRSALITGANSGIGKEVARQLALRDTWDTIYLACRDDAKAQAARTDLESTTGKTIFKTVPLNTSDLDSVGTAVDAVGAPLAAVVLNAGGMGGSTPRAWTVDGVTEIFAANVLGHVVLMQELIARALLTDVAVMVGSEAARGVSQLRIKRPTFADHSVAEFTSVIDGSYFDSGKVDGSLMYGQVKYLAALWMSHLALEHPELRLLTVSPGNTSGTDVFREMPAPVRTVLNRVLMPLVFPRIGLAHSTSTGAKRLVNAVVDTDLKTGVFYASAPGKLTGPLVDQSVIVADFADAAIQYSAAKAINRFLDTSTS